MPVTVYTYSLAGDTLDGTMVASCLLEEVNAEGGINETCTLTELDDDVIDITMSDAVDAGEKTLLDAVVAAHSASNCPAGNPSGTDPESDFVNVPGDTMTGDLTMSGSARHLNTDGTQALPSYSFASDPDTGMYREGSGDLAFSNSNLCTLEIAPNGHMFMSPADLPTYETLVTTDNSIPNKKYVDDALAADSGAFSDTLLGGDWTLDSGTIYVGTVTHSMGTTDVAVSIEDNATGRLVGVHDVEIVDTNSVKVYAEGNAEDLKVNVVTGRGPQGPTGPAGSTTVDGLTDTTITSVTTGEVLTWNGSAWINETLAEAGISATGHTHTESDITDLGSYIENVVEDTTPQLGGNLDVNQKLMTYTVPSVDHSATGSMISVTVDTNAVGFGGALRMASDGNFDSTDADSASTMPCRALALASGTGTKDVLLQGFIRDNTWTWTPGGDIFVSTTAASLTQTAPSGSGDHVQKVGFAWTADIIYFNPGDYTVVEVA